MIAIKDVNDARRAKDCLRAALEFGKWLLVSDQSDIPIPMSPEYELRLEWGKLLFCWWTVNRAGTWRVTGFEISDSVLRLQVRQGIARNPIVITLVRSTADSVERAGFLKLLERGLQDLDPTLRVCSSNSGEHRSSHGSTGYARLVLDRFGATTLVVGVSRSETQPTIDGIVEVALVWAARFNERRGDGTGAAELWLAIPAERTQRVIERLTLISVEHLGLRLRCLEVDVSRGTLNFVGIAAQMDLMALHPRRLRWPIKRRRSEEMRALAARIVALAPEVIEVRQSSDSARERFLIHGLEFARWSRDSRGGLWFGVHAWVEFDGHNFEELAGLVREIAKSRCASAPERRHLYYRLRGEAWLESMIRRDIGAFDPSIDDRYVYSQVPTWRGEERSVLDLLTINRKGRLVIVEVKASEDPKLPLQGLDYWLRVEQARRQGQFQERGLFLGVEITDQSPLLYLVSPRLRFHRSFEVVTRCISSEIEVHRIAVNANWRSGVKVVSRERMNGGKKEG